MGLGLGAVVSELAFIHGHKQHVWSEWLQLGSEAGCLALLSKKQGEVWKAASQNALCASSVLFSELGLGLGLSPSQCCCHGEQVRGAYPSQPVCLLLAHRSSRGDVR